VGQGKVRDPPAPTPADWPEVSLVLGSSMRGVPTVLVPTLRGSGKLAPCAVQAAVAGRGEGRAELSVSGGTREPTWWRWRTSRRASTARCTTSRCRRCYPNSKP